MTYIILGIVGLVAVVAAFVWINRNKPDLLDSAEQKVRDFKK